MPKKCKYCMSEIDSECSKCPVCKEWQNKYKNPNVITIVVAILVFLAISIISKYTINKTLKGINARYFQSADTHNLQIVWHKTFTEKSNKYIIGEVKNNGLDTFENLEIGAEFYDDKNELIKLGSSYISQKLVPGSSRKFQLFYKNTDCQGESEKIKDFHSYKLAIDGGRLSLNSEK